MPKPSRNVSAVPTKGQVSDLITGSVSGLNPMLEDKLWRNPAWFSFRLNYLALRYNLPVYDWAKRMLDLSRPECVVIYSLALSDGGQARDIVRTSGFPKNTLSRAISRLEEKKLIVRSRAPGRGRNQHLHLSAAGRDLFNEILPVFLNHEHAMLSGLTTEEQATLSQLLAKMVLHSGDWPNELPDNPPRAEIDRQTTEDMR